MPERSRPVHRHGDDILRALRKLEAMRADMGSVNPIIASQLPDLLKGAAEISTRDLQKFEARMEKSRHFLKTERDLRERVAKLHDRLTEIKARAEP
jgi:hypothetical protein